MSDITLPSVNGWYVVRGCDGGIFPVLRSAFGPDDGLPWAVMDIDARELLWRSDEDMIRFIRVIEDPHLYRLRLGEEVR